MIRETITQILIESFYFTALTRSVRNETKAVKELRRPSRYHRRYHLPFTLFININLFIATGRIPHLGADIGSFQVLGLILEIDIGHVDQIRLVTITTVDRFRFWTGLKS